MDRRNGATSRFSQFCVTLKIMNKIFLGDIKLFRRFCALRVRSLIAARLFFRLINFNLQIKLATLQGK
jgi:hypothetical protein